MDALLDKRILDRRIFGNSTRMLRLIEQRDALGLSLDIAQLDRQRELRRLDVGRVGDSQSVLDLLDAEPLHEQDLIRQDERVFGELFDRSMRHARFTGSQQHGLRVHVYDKKPLETVLGVDLLIYQEVYESFILVQYKSMEHGPGRRGMTWSYLVDAHIHQQIRAMDAAEAAIEREVSLDGDMRHWRLHSSPFYFKFCETTRPQSRDDSLVRGMTLGLSYLKRFLSLDDSAGRDGGRRVGYENCPRYLNNTDFVGLARGGWIGCDQSGHGLISRVLEANKLGGRQAMLAVVEGTALLDARRRGWRRR